MGVNLPGASEGTSGIVTVRVGPFGLVEITVVVPEGAPWPPLFEGLPWPAEAPDDPLA